MVDTCLWWMDSIIRIKSPQTTWPVFCIVMKRSQRSPHFAPVKVGRRKHACEKRGRLHPRGMTGTYSKNTIHVSLPHRATSTAVNIFSKFIAASSCNPNCTYTKESFSLSSIDIPRLERHREFYSSLMVQPLLQADKKTTRLFFHLKFDLLELSSESGCWLINLWGEWRRLHSQRASGNRSLQMLSDLISPSSSPLSFMCSLSSDPPCLPVSL